MRNIRLSRKVGAFPFIVARTKGKEKMENKKNMLTLKIEMNEDMDRMEFSMRGEGKLRDMAPLAILRLILELPSGGQLEKTMRKALGKALKNDDLAMQMLVLLSHEIQNSERKEAMRHASL
nr:MAG TPA: hypothetical protein [Caudoviricetes sp.]